LVFEGRDRRLFYNKAVCELQLGEFNLCVNTCETYLQPVIEAKRHKRENQFEAKFEEMDL